VWRNAGDAPNPFCAIPRHLELCLLGSPSVHIHVRPLVTEACPDSLLLARGACSHLRLQAVAAEAAEGTGHQR